MDARSDEDLLIATAVTPAAFGVFYRRYVDAVLAYFVVRTRQADVAADLTAETFAAALHASRRYRRQVEPASAWLFTIAHAKLVDAVRRGVVADRARARLAIEPLTVSDEDIERVETLADLAAGGASALGSLVERLPATQREAVLAYVLDERSYPELARELRCSEAVVRKRVSRGLATLRAQLQEQP